LQLDPDARVAADDDVTHEVEAAAPLRRSPGDLDAGAVSSQFFRLDAGFVVLSITQDSTP
jgi:hypothetical protein